MTRTPPSISIRGVSGAVYEYAHAGDDTPATGGNFAFAKLSGDTLESLLYAGETTDLLSVATAEHPIAFGRFGATHVLVRPNADAELRKREQQDIVRAHRPAMNPA